MLISNLHLYLVLLKFIVCKKTFDMRNFALIHWLGTEYCNDYM